MKFKIFSEDYPDGLNVDWAAVPGTGDFVSLRYKGGTSKLTVDRVEYTFDVDEKSIEVAVYLTY
ncbi:hypothetical protein [Mesorhizobium sp. 128a]